MDLTSLDERRQTEAPLLEEVNLDLWSQFKIPRQERRQDALDGLRRRADAEHAGLTPAHGLGLLGELSGGGQQRVAALQEPLAVARQADAPPRALEEPHAELCLEVAHLSRQRGLGEAEPGRRP